MVTDDGAVVGGGPAGGSTRGDGGVGDAPVVHVRLGGGVGGGAGLGSSRGERGDRAGDGREVGQRVGDVDRGQGHVAGVGNQVAVGDDRARRGEAGRSWPISPSMIPGLCCAGMITVAWSVRVRTGRRRPGARGGVGDAPAVDVGLGGGVGGGTGLGCPRGERSAGAGDRRQSGLWVVHGDRVEGLTLPVLVTR